MSMSFVARSTSTDGILFPPSPETNQLSYQKIWNRSRLRTQEHEKTPKKNRTLFLATKNGKSLLEKKKMRESQETATFGGLKWRRKLRSSKGGRIRRSWMVSKRPAFGEHDNFFSMNSVALFVCFWLFLFGLVSFVSLRLALRPLRPSFFLLFLCLFLIFFHFLFLSLTARVKKGNF